MRHSVNMLRMAGLVLSVTFINGCGRKPFKGVPKEVTIPQVLAAIDRYSSNIKDFSGSASVKVVIDGRTQSANIAIRFINPGRFRIYIKGFAGIDIARINALDDSVTVYIPSENVYVSAGREKNILGVLIPDIDIDLKSMESIFTGTLPHPENFKEFQITMKNIGRKVELIMKRDKYTYRYIVEGSDLRPTDEEILYDGVTVWRKKTSGYSSYNGVKFPDNISIEQGGNVIDLKFSRCVINSGLSEKDLSFFVPSSAKRLVIE